MHGCHWMSDDHNEECPLSREHGLQEPRLQCVDGRLLHKHRSADVPVPPPLSIEFQSVSLGDDRAVLDGVSLLMS